MRDRCRRERTNTGNRILARRIFYSPPRANLINNLSALFHTLMDSAERI